MIKHSLISFFILLIAFSSWAKLDISNLPKALQEDIQSNFSNYNQTTSLSELDKILKHLVKTYDYKNVSLIKKSKGSYLIRLNYQKIRNIEFVGNKKFKTKNLLTKLSLRKGNRYNTSDIFSAAKKIQTFYGNRGYLKTTVQVDLKKRKENPNVDIKFIIKEGKPAYIESIIIKTKNKKLKKSTTKILNKFKKSLLEKNILKAVRKKAIEHLNKSGYILSQIKIDSINYNKQKTKAFLLIAVSHPKKYRFRIVGNKHFSEVTALRFLKINKNYGRNTSPFNQMKQQLINNYLKKGFATVQVEVIKKKQGRFKETISFKVTEGPRLRIKSIHVAGNISRSKRYYSNFIKKSSSSLIRQGFFNEHDLKNGYMNLIAHLKNQGFLRAKVQFSRNNYQHGYVQPFLVINEGIQTVISEINFKGSKQVSDKILLKEIDLKVGEALNFKKFEQSLEKLKAYYLANGYLEMRILNSKKENLIQYTDSHINASINYSISEGYLSKVSSIVIRGNNFTKRKTILRQITLAEGDILTPDIIENSKSELSRSGLFDLVEILTEQGVKNTKNVIITVSERRPGQFKLGLGLTSQLGLTLRAYSSISYVNLFGTGRAASARISLKSVQQATELTDEPSGRFSLTYLEPTIFGSHINGRVNVAYGRDIYSIDAPNKKVDFTEDQHLGFLIEKDFSKEIKLSWTLWSNENQKFYSKPQSRSLNLARDINIATIGPNFYIDYRDNPFLPTSGYYLNVNAQYSSENLGSSSLIEFLRSEFDYRIYQPLFYPKKITWANAIRGGYIDNRHPDPNSGIPFAKAFFLGGHSTIRGFGGNREIERIPNNFIVEIDPKNPEQLIQTRNIAYALFKSELRFPIYESFGGTIFYDGGGVFIQGKEQQKLYRQSYGIGLRVNTPVGPLSLDFAWKHSPQTYPNGQKESPFRIHFSIGTF